MQVVDALEVILYLRVVKLYHLYHFVNCLLSLVTFKKDSELPLTSLNPKVEGAWTLGCNEILCLLIVFLSQE